jgi:hypothetical protein
MSNTVQVIVTKMPAFWGNRTIDNRVNKRITASDDSQEEKIAEQWDKWFGRGAVILDRVVSESGISELTPRSWEGAREVQRD